MDPLSDLLALLKPRSYISRAFEIAPHLGISWPQHEGIKCYAIICGECWLTVEGSPGPLHLTAGDCILLPPGPPFCMTTDLAVTPVSYEALLARGNNDLPPANQPGSSSFFGGHFLLSGDHADLLLRSLPPIVHLRGEADKAAMRWSLERMKDEVHNPQPGGSLIAQQLAYMILIQALRLYMAEGAHGSTGWLFALADKQMCAALSAIHAQPGAPWTLQSLAERVGMSRSTFAARFKGTVGMTPLDYLTRWRMMLAGERLKNSSEGLSTIAQSLGYDSDSAFGKAFRRVMGSSPRQYSRKSRASHADTLYANPALSSSLLPSSTSTGRTVAPNRPPHIS